MQAKIHLQKDRTSPTRLPTKEGKENERGQKIPSNTHVKKSTKKCQKQTEDSKNEKAATPLSQKGTGQPAKTKKIPRCYLVVPKGDRPASKKQRKYRAATSWPKRGRPASKKTTLTYLDQSKKYLLPITNY